jgi:hypothetical protein
MASFREKKKVFFCVFWENGITVLERIAKEKIV